RFTISPWLGVAHVAMYPQQWEEGSGLKPADEELVIECVGVLVCGPEKATGVVCPPGQARAHLTKPSGDLATKCLPVVTDITRPGSGAIPLHTGKGAACKDEGTPCG